MCSGFARKIISAAHTHTVLFSMPDFFKHFAGILFSSHLRTRMLG